ncbi:MAG TPA: tetratricopeptide repeat protein, partial [Bacteroidales bacterium]|nr:tetratricopeptide repeat protein [Bacteroidales bacterium]
YISTLKRSLSEKHYKTGFNHYRNNNFEAAFAEYRRAIDYNPENTSAQVELDRVGKDLAQKYFEQGMSYFSRSEMDKAREMFKKSLSYQPDKPESLRALERIR